MSYTRTLLVLHGDDGVNVRQIREVVDFHAESNRNQKDGKRIRTYTRIHTNTHTHHTTLHYTTLHYTPVVADGSGLVEGHGAGDVVETRLVVA